MTTHTQGRLKAVEHYSDSVSIVDDKGFEIFEAEHTAVLLGYAEKLGISHWALDSRASRDLGAEEQAANARRLVACWNACEGISTENLEQNLPVRMLADSYNTAIDHLHALLGKRLNATQMLEAERAARGWLAGIGGEPS